MRVPKQDLGGNRETRWDFSCQTKYLKGSWVDMLAGKTGAEAADHPCLCSFTQQYLLPCRCGSLHTCLHKSLGMNQVFGCSWMLWRQGQHWKWGKGVQHKKYYWCGWLTSWGHCWNIWVSQPTFEYHGQADLQTRRTSEWEHTDLVCCQTKKRRMKRHVLPVGHSRPTNQSLTCLKQKSSCTKAQESHLDSR